jgi:CubicO group peptidase (beta-lactamase class C family)
MIVGGSVTSPAMGSLDVIGRWPGRHAAAVVTATTAGTAVARSWGDVEAPFAYASVTKLATALAVLVEVARGRCDLADLVGPPGATLAHLLSHASGLALEGAAPVAAVGARRIYSNVGIDLAVDHAADRSGVTPARLVAANVFEPLGMARTALEGRASSGVVGPVVELAKLAAELLVPTLVAPGLAAMQRTVQFPGLVGVLPGFGRQVPCDWGLGPEVKGSKQPHWTGSTWPATTVGHFGQAGGFVAADTVRGLAVVTLGDAAFGPWAIESWPALTDDVRRERLASVAVDHVVDLALGHGDELAT